MGSSDGNASGAEPSGQGNILYLIQFLQNLGFYRNLEGSNGTVELILGSWGSDDKLRQYPSERHISRYGKYRLRRRASNRKGLRPLRQPDSAAA